MIRSISLKNFQSHQESTLEFVPGINVITGASDCGKTAILRALNWVISNRPTGDAFRSSWGGDTQVNVVVDNGGVVIREKNDKKNSYYVGAPYKPKATPDFIELKAMGTDVPEDVTRALNVGPVNIQYQMDAPFMLSLTPGEAGRQLNQVVNLEVIDRTVSNVNGFVRRAQAERSRHEADADAASKELASFSYLEAAEEDLAKIELGDDKIIATRDEAGRIGSLLEKIRDARSAANRYAYLDGAPEKLKQMERAVSARNAAASSEARLSKILYDLSKAASAATATETADDEKKELDEIVSRFSKVEKLADSLDDAERILRVVATARKDRDDAVAKYSAAKKEYDKILPEVCPLCGSPIRK